MSTTANIESAALLSHTGQSILGSGELAAKTFATWLPNPVESVLHVSPLGRTWVHQEVAPRVTRHQIAVRAVRKAINDAPVPFKYTQTAPHRRQIRDLALADAGIELAADEIHRALVEVMAP